MLKINRGLVIADENAAEMTAHNAFVRINSNRIMAGMPMLTDAPVYTNDVPEGEYDDLWISEDVIVFTGLVVPSESYRLVVKMSPALSPGTSNGWSNMPRMWKSV